ncbi:MAG: HigA family addiction module antitoxin [Candidatus Korobacteraceae bacterium]
MAGKAKGKASANAVHPGEILREEFMVPLGLTSAELARQLHISVPRVNEIARERRAITADTAMRLGRYFGTSAKLWMNLQIEYDLNLAAASRDIKKIKPRDAA